MGKKKAPVEPIKLTDDEQELLAGWLARQELIRLQAQRELQAIEGKIKDLAGEGRTLKQEQDGVYKVEAEE